MLIGGGRQSPRLAAPDRSHCKSWSVGGSATSLLAFVVVFPSYSYRDQMLVALYLIMQTIHQCNKENVKKVKTWLPPYNITEALETLDKSTWVAQKQFMFGLMFTTSSPQKYSYNLFWWVSIQVRCSQQQKPSISIHNILWSQLSSVQDQDLPSFQFIIKNVILLSLLDGTDDFQSASSAAIFVHKYLCPMLTTTNHLNF